MLVPNTDRSTASSDLTNAGDHRMQRRGSSLSPGVALRISVLGTSTKRKMRGTVMLDEQGNAVQRSARSAGGSARFRSSRRLADGRKRSASASSGGSLTPVAGAGASTPVSPGSLPGTPSRRTPARTVSVWASAELDGDDDDDDGSLDNIAVDRPYTIVRRHRSGHLVLYVKRYEGGNVSRFICDAPIGSIIALKGPMGLGMRLDNTAMTADNVIVAIVQGTGINCAFDLLQMVWRRYERRWDYQRRLAARQIAAARAAAKTKSRSKRRKYLAFLEATGADPANITIPPPLPTFPGWKDDLIHITAPGDSSIAPTQEDATRSSSPKRLPHNAISGAAGTGMGGTAMHVSDAEASDASPKLVPANALPGAVGDESGSTSVGGSLMMTTRATLARSVVESVERRPSAAGTGPSKHSTGAEGTGTGTGPTESGDNTASVDDDSDEDVDSSLGEVTTRLRMVLLCCFEREEAIMEREALAWFHAHCPDIRIIFNVSRRNAPGHVLGDGDADGGPATVTGRLTAEKLVDILPRSDLTTVCCCGSPMFVEDVRSIYLTLGLPRPLFAAVA